MTTPDLDPQFAPLHQPVHDFIINIATQAQSRPVVIGLQAPQGAGKTTLVTHLLRRLPTFGLRGIAVSIDDFYLTRAEQVALAAANPGNPYLEHRGYPGTHDVALGRETLVGLRSLEAGTSTRVPVYDKSAHSGRGDRAPETEWREVNGPLDVIVVEGWMLGFSPVDEATLPDAHMRPANAALAQYTQWYRLIDHWIVLRAADPRFVLEWRVEAEERMKASGKPGLTREQIEDYIRRFLPAYETWADGSAAGHTPDFTLTIAKDRTPVSTSASPS